MKNIALVLLLGFIFCANASAQGRPFETFDKAIKEEKSGFDGDKGRLSLAFSTDRKNLGSQFESELWKYLNDDIDKHYLAGLFLQSPTYLHDLVALPQLALTVWSNALKLKGNVAVDRRFTLLVLSSVLAAKLNQQDVAMRFKVEAVKIAEADAKNDLGFPRMNEYERCLYENIDADPTRCTILKDVDPAKEIIDGAALELPQPHYPDDLKKKKIRGRVEVQITISEQGLVTAAEAVSGPSELFAAAVDAAKRARFVPTIKSGKAKQITGFINFNFKP